MNLILKSMPLLAVLAVAGLVGPLPVGAAPNDLPRQESFETYANGQSLSGTSGWSLAGSGEVVVTNLSYTFTSDRPLATSYTNILDRWGDVTLDVTAATATNVYCDLMISAGQRRNLTTNVLDASVRTAFGVDTNGLLNVWHQTDPNHDGTPDGAQWTALNNTPLASNAWARVTFVMDSTSDTIHNYRYVQVRLQGHTLTNVAAFAQPDGTLQAGGSWFIMGGAGGPSIDSLEFDGYGKSDDLVLQYVETWPPPVAVADEVTVQEGIVTTLSPLTNDTNSADESMALISCTQPSHGVTATMGVNQVQYTATTGYVGPDAFTYRIVDAHGALATGTVSVTVQTRPPVAVADSASVLEGIPTLLSPLANDSDPANDAIMLQSWAQPTHGVTTSSGVNQVLYTATVGYVGPDTFAYTIVDAFGAQASATVTLDVASRAPVTGVDTVVATQIVACVVAPLVNDSDPAGDTISMQSFAQPSHGVTASAGVNLIQYTAEGTYVGADAFTYVITDASGNLATGTVNVTVQTRPPVAVADSASVLEGVPTLISPLDNDSDPAGETISLQTCTQPAHGSTTTNGVNQVQYTATVGYVGPDTFTYTMADQYGATASATVTLDVLNRPPVTVNDSLFATQGVARIIAPLANDSDPAGNVISLQSFMQPIHGVTTGAGANLIQYTAMGTYVGADAFTYVIADSLGALATGTVNITVQPYLTNALPWRESFEAYSTGMNVLGTNGWTGTGEGIVTNMEYPFSSFLPLENETHTQILAQAEVMAIPVTATPAANVYCDMMIRPGYRRNLTALDAGVRAAVGVDVSGFLNVWHETDPNANGVRDGALWTQLSNVPLASNAWARVTLILDNASDTICHYSYVQVLLNGITLSHAGAFARPDGTLQVGGTWFIMAGSSVKSIESLEFNGYGFSDDLVIDYGTPQFGHGSVYLVR